MANLTSLVDRAFGLSPSDGRSYRYGARACPALAVAGTLLDPSLGAPTTAPSLTTGANPTTLIAGFNEVAADVDALGRFGGGGRAVCYGLDLVPPASGLNLVVTAGLAMVDGPIPLSVNATQAISDNMARTLLWLTNAGALSPATNLTQPGLPAAYLGSVPSAGNRIGTADYSGVARLRGGTLWRRTADAGKPDDTIAAGWSSDPPGSLQFFHRTEGGWWWWDGVAYVSPQDAEDALSALVAAAQADIDERGRLFRVLLLNLVNVLGGCVLAGLEEEFALALAEG